MYLTDGTAFKCKRPDSTQKQNQNNVIRYKILYERREFHRAKIENRIQIFCQNRYCADF